MDGDDVLTAAPVTPLVFAVLVQGDRNGYEILEGVRELSGGQLEWPDGMLYPLLRRLHRLGYVQPQWRTPPDGDRRRYYAITAAAAHPRDDLESAAVTS